MYFDNLKVGHQRGRIIEENHYYSYGLKIAALSSVKLGNPNEGQLANQHLYNDKELIEEGDLGWYDYGFRNYDPQIGRFPQLDPLTDYYPYYTPYQYAGNEPIANTDVDGLEPAGAIGAGASAFSYSYNMASKATLFLAPATQVLSAANKTVSVLQTALSVTSMLIQVANTTTTLINTDVNTRGVGNGNGQNGFRPLDKATFLNYVKSTECSSCGTGELQNKAGARFEKLFDQFIDENFAFDNFRVIKTTLNDKVPGNLRNTVPDYLGVKYSATDKKRVELTSFYELETFFELKATKNNIGLGAFEGQLKAQIEAAKKLKVREIILITTSGIKLTKPLIKYATENGVSMTHYWSEYMITPDNRMKLNFKPAKYE